MAKTSGPDRSAEAMIERGKLARNTTTKLPEGYAQGGVPGGRGGGMHVGRSSHSAMMRLGRGSPSKAR